MLTGAPGAAAETVRGLVVGIDDYVELRDLQGAVNDARDIAGALARVGVRDLVVLENGTATRRRLAAEWEALVARSAEGDTLVLTYAGHGGQEPARVPGTERDGRDEVLLLGGFRANGPGTRERIFDDELNQWFVEAGRRGLKVVFVADSCHSGTLTRSVDSRAPAPVLRTAAYTITDDMLDLEGPATEAAAIDEAELPHVNFLAAGQEHEQVPEIALPGAAGGSEPRGALSYAFARAVEGKADLDRDGVLRRGELWRFVRENVRMMSEARQTPNLLPTGGGDEPVLPIAAGAVLEEGGMQAISDETPGLGMGAWETQGGPVRIAVLNASPETHLSFREALPDADVVLASQSPDLVWDARAREVVTGMGDVVAYDVGVAELPGVVEKWAAVRAIRTLSAAASLRLRVHPHDGAHREGTRIVVEVGGLRHPRLTLIGLAGTGNVHYLYPLAGDPDAVSVDGPFRLPLEVTPPFGADHIVAVSAGSTLASLNAALAELDGRRAAGAAVERLVAAAASATDWWSGIQGLYTRP